MLAVRLKLVVHRSTRFSQVYLLAVSQIGPKLNETEPADPHSGSYRFPGGGRLSMELRGDQMMIHDFSISMAQIANLCSNQVGRPVQDKTGLSGQYDITIQKTAHPVTPGQPIDSTHDSFDPSIVSLMKGLGLKLESAKEPVEMLVIDHVERPTEN
jgi:uncharacterized protein (TIGR03435 family)